MVKAMLDHAKVEHLVTVAYDHQANGQAERMVRVTRDTIEKLIRESDQEQFRNRWEELVPRVQFALNNRVHRVTQATPFALMFGRSAFAKVSANMESVEHGPERLMEFWQTYHREVGDGEECKSRASISRTVSTQDRGVQSW